MMNGMDQTIVIHYKIPNYKIGSGYKHKITDNINRPASCDYGYYCCCCCCFLLHLFYNCIMVRNYASLLIIIIGHGK